MTWHVKDSCKAQIDSQSISPSVPMGFPIIFSLVLSDEEACVVFTEPRVYPGDSQESNQLQAHDCYSIPQEKGFEDVCGVNLSLSLLTCRSRAGPAGLKGGRGRSQ